MSEQVPSKERFPDPENDLFSDAMDAAASAFHSTRYGIVKNAALAAEPIDGERTVRRSLAAAFKAYVAEIGPADEPPAALSELQSLASHLGGGGIDCTDAAELGKRIRWAIDHHIRATLERAASLVEPTEVTTLFDKDFETKRDARESGVRRRLAAEIRSLMPEGRAPEPPRAGLDEYTIFRRAAAADVQALQGHIAALYQLIVDMGWNVPDDKYHILTAAAQAMEAGFPIPQPSVTKSARPFTPMDREQLREKIAADPDPDPEIGAGSQPIDWNEVAPVDAKEVRRGRAGHETGDAP